MIVRFDYPDSQSPTVSWRPTLPPQWPVQHRIDYPEQVQGRTAGGTLMVQQLGNRSEHWELCFDRLSPGDRDAARVLFDTVQKAFSAFDFTDGEGTVHRVRWVNAFEFQAAAAGRFHAVMQLRKE